MNAKVERLFKNWMFWLFIITLVAIVIRSLPAWINYAWGADFGIYYGLTSRLMESQQIFTPYDGWGSSYNYFPVLYLVSAFGQWVAGADLIWVMAKIAPIFGGLTVLIFYFIVYELTKKRNIALLSSAFLAVIPFHVYQTSHAAPLTMGHFFMMLSLYLFIKYTQNHKYLILLMISTLLLVLSHHLTTYFYLLSLLCIVIVKSLNVGLKELWREVTYLVLCSAVTFSYWFLIATPVSASFMAKGTVFGSLQIMVLFYLLIFAGLFGIQFLKKYMPRIFEPIKKLFWSNKPYQHKRALTYFVLSLIGLICTEVIFLNISFPASGIKMTPLAIIYSLPVLIFISLGFMGLECMRNVKNSWFFKAWLLATVGSFFYSVVTLNETLFPDRHIEYIAPPLCFVVAVGIVKLYRRFVQTHHDFSITKESLAQPIKSIALITIIGAILFSNAIAVYPVYDSLEWMDESIQGPTINAISWMNEHVDPNSSVVATDFRLSKLLWAEGYSTTFNQTREIWYAETWEECLVDLDYNRKYDRVTHIMIDDVMWETSVNVDLKVSIYMTNESYNKFSFPPFEQIYRNAALNQKMEETHWTEIYSVNWTFIEENSGKLIP